MNKRGDITIAVLVIGIVVICFLALLSFYMSNLHTDDNFDSINLVQKINTKIENLDFSDKVTDASGTYIKEEKIKDTSWWFGGEKTVFYVRYFISK